MFKIGDTVKIKVEWCNSEAERTLDFEVIDVNEATGSFKIRAKDSKLALVPIEPVRLCMIERIN